MPLHAPPPGRRNYCVDTHHAASHMATNLALSIRPLLDPRLPCERVATRISAASPRPAGSSSRREQPPAWRSSSAASSGFRATTTRPNVTSPADEFAASTRRCCGRWLFPHLRAWPSSGVPEVVHSGGASRVADRSFTHRHCVTQAKCLPAVLPAPKTVTSSWSASPCSPFSAQISRITSPRPASAILAAAAAVSRSGTIDALLIQLASAPTT